MKKQTRQKIVQIFVILAILGMVISSFAGGLLSLF